MQARSNKYGRAKNHMGIGVDQRFEYIELSSKCQSFLLPPIIVKIKPSCYIAKQWKDRTQGPIQGIIAYVQTIISNFLLVFHLYNDL